MAGFTIRVVHDAGSPNISTLSLAGEIDLAAHEEVIAAGKHTLTQCMKLRVDLSGVTFLDSTGLSALLVLMAEAEVAEARIEFDHPSPRIERLFEMAGVGDVVTKPGA